MTAYIEKGQPAYIEELVIAPEHQGHGLGRHILSLLFHELAHRRVCRVGLAVLIANYQAQDFYEKNGFHYVAAGHREFLMERRLLFRLSLSRGFAPYKPYVTPSMPTWSRERFV
jgi:ribosomal protein S18 acetylase RimI-like enzyme